MRHYLVVMEDGQPQLFEYDTAEQRTEHLRKQDPDGDKDFYILDSDNDGPNYGAVEFHATPVGEDLDV